MSLISKLLVKLNPIKNLYTRNINKIARRNISKRFTIGKDCEPQEEPECPQTCKKRNLPMSQACICKKQCGEERTKPIGDFGDATYTDKNMGDHTATVKKPGQYTTEKCDPFPSDESELKKKLLRCKSNMRHPCDTPSPEHKCSLNTGKILYTTNERPVEKLPNCPKGNWSYDDKRNFTS